MRLTNEVVLPAAPDTVFSLINDVERVAPCLPGATLEGKSGEDSYQGRVQVKVGPISAAYHGTVRFLEVDDAAHRLVLDAKGTDQHGSGNAEAKVEVRVGPHPQGSTLSLDTDLVIRGKVAQFGRGALGDVSQKLMEQFARNLGGLLSGDDQHDTARGASRTEEPGPDAGSATHSPAVADSATGPAESELDGMALVLRPLAKRALPVLTAVVAGIAVGRLSSRGAPRSRRVLADEVVTATVHIGARRFQVPARQVTSLLRRP